MRRLYTHPEGGKKTSIPSGGTVPSASGHPIHGCHTEKNPLTDLERMIFVEVSKDGHDPALTLKLKNVTTESPNTVGIGFTPGLTTGVSHGLAVHTRTAAGRTPGGVAYDHTTGTTLPWNDGVYPLEPVSKHPGKLAKYAANTPVTSSPTSAVIAPAILFVNSTVSTMFDRTITGTTIASTPVHHSTLITPLTDKVTGKAHFRPGVTSTTSMTVTGTSPPMGGYNPLEPMTGVT